MHATTLVTLLGIALVALAQDGTAAATASYQNPDPPCGGPAGGGPPAETSGFGAGPYTSGGNPWIGVGVWTPVGNYYAGLCATGGLGAAIHLR